jgi:CRISPR-associated protein Csx16
VNDSTIGKVLFVTRHAGALDWAREQGLGVATAVVHLDVATLEPGDTVIGTLPVHLAAEVCARGARYLHLVLDLPVHLRGIELNAAQMTQCGARVEPFEVIRGRESLSRDPRADV